MILTISELKAKNVANGMCWFDRKTMRFWNTKIHGGIRQGKYFITSEDNYDRTKRLFSIRSFDDDGDVNTVGEFQAYHSLEDAKEAIKALKEVA